MVTLKTLQGSRKLSLNLYSKSSINAFKTSNSVMITKMSTQRWTKHIFVEPIKKANRKQKTKTYREPPPMAATESTFGPPLTGDENIWVLGANACCCDELPNTPATGCWWPCDPTAEPPCKGNDFDGDPPKASRIESFKSSKAVFVGVLKTPCAGDAVCDPFVLGGGGRAGGPAALPWPLLAFSPANNDCCASTCETSSVKNGFSSFPAACE